MYVYWQIVDYWEKESRTPELRGKMEGMMHSMLATLDGCSMDIPGFKIIPMTDESDKDFHIQFGENWYPQEDTDIGGGLHEIMRNYKPKE